MAVDEPFLTLYNDPGEDFGWCVGKGTALLAAGTEKMWTMIDLIWDKMTLDEIPETNPLHYPHFIRDGVDPDLMLLPIGRVVCEDWRIYPWEAANLAWDQCRTARAIGAITFICRMFRIPLILQGADIKEAAKAAGAEELYYRPLRENRHQNDAIQHFVFFTNVELMGIPLPIPESVSKEVYE